MAPLVQNESLIQIDLTPRKPIAKPAWLKARAPVGETFHALKKMARDLNLHTVCESAHCPNIGECWNQKSATFMMLGNLCTRRCGFCAGNAEMVPVILRQRWNERCDIRPLISTIGRRRAALDRIRLGHRSDSMNSARLGRQ